MIPPSGVVEATRTGNLPLEAEVKKMGRSQAVPVADVVSLAIRSPVHILDADTSPNVRNADDSPMSAVLLARDVANKALEVFASPTPAGKDDVTMLAPIDDSTSRAFVSLAPNAPCAAVSLAAGVSNATLASMLVDAECLRATATPHDIAAGDDVAADLEGRRDAFAPREATHTSQSRVRGCRGIFPTLIENDTASRSTMPARLGADISAIDNVLAGHGAPAEACTAPVFVDFEFAP